MSPNMPSTSPTACASRDDEERRNTQAQTQGPTPRSAEPSSQSPIVSKSSCSISGSCGDHAGAHLQCAQSPSTLSTSSGYPSTSSQHSRAISAFAFSRSHQLLTLSSNAGFSENPHVQLFSGHNGRRSSHPEGTPITTTLNLQSVSTVTSRSGLKILRSAVDAKLCSEVATTIKNGLPILNEHGSHMTFVNNNLPAYHVRDAFNATASTALQDFYIPPMQTTIPHHPQTHHVCAFTSTESPDTVDQDPTYSMLQSHNSLQIYVLIALNHLNSAVGLYTFFYGSHGPLHPRHTPVSSWYAGNGDLNLSPGDAIIYRGDISYLLSPGGGGMFEILVYDWGLETIDLTGKDGRKHDIKKREKNKHHKRCRHHDEDTSPQASHRVGDGKVKEEARTFESPGGTEQIAPPGGRVKLFVTEKSLDEKKRVMVGAEGREKKKKKSVPSDSPV